MGKKIHSIRKPGRWKEGMTIHHSFGARSKKYRCFWVNKCTGIQKIEFKPNFNIKIDGVEITKDEMFCLANNDGFNGIYPELDFLSFFYKKNEIIPKIMDIVHWTNFRY
jgi:hypothetical protein